MTCCMRSPSIRIGGAWRFSRIEFTNPRIMRSPTNARMRARSASSSGSPGSTNLGTRPSRWIMAWSMPAHAPDLGRRCLLRGRWAPYGVLDRCCRAFGERMAADGGGLDPKRCAPEPTPGIEPETSFLPTTSLPALWHSGVDPERNASDYGVSRFGWSRYPWLGRPSGSQLTRMIRDLPSAITKAIGFAPQREDSTLERAAQQTGDDSTVLDTN